MSKDSDTKALVPVEAVEVNAAGLKEFLGKFNMSMEPTPENVEMAMQQIEVYGRMVDAVNTVGIVERGKRFIFIKSTMKHGDWVTYLKERVSGIPVRTIQWWMAEARYTIEHGHRQMRGAALLNAPGAAHFDEADAETFSADDLADPTKPAPRSREELENDVERYETRMKAGKKREEALLNERDMLAKELKAARRKKDPDEYDEEQTPIKSALLKALLVTGRARLLVQEASDMKVDFLETDCPAKVLASVSSQLQHNVQTICDLGRPLIMAAVRKHNAEKKST